MPSIVDIDEDNVSDPETTGSSTGHLNARQLRKRYSDTLQHSGESNMPPHDLETLSETEDESVSYPATKNTQTNSNIFFRETPLSDTKRLPSFLYQGFPRMHMTNAMAAKKFLKCSIPARSCSFGRLQHSPVIGW